MGFLSAVFLPWKIEHRLRMMNGVDSTPAGSPVTEYARLLGELHTMFVAGKDEGDEADAIRDQMPSQVRKLAELCLHDAELLAFEQAEPATAILSLKQNDSIVSIIYHLSGDVQDNTPTPDWPFSKRRVHWLYDEIDVGANRAAKFEHRILFSDGRVLAIPFTSVIVHVVALPQSHESDTPRQSA